MHRCNPLPATNIRHQIGMAPMIQETHTTGRCGSASTTRLSQVCTALPCKLSPIRFQSRDNNSNRTFGTSIYTPATASIMEDFDISRTVAIVGLTLYTLGLGFGPIFSAPLSEKHGRKIVYLLSAPLFMIFTVGAGFSKSVTSLMICRFFAGLTGSPALAVGAGSNADIFEPRYRAKVTSLFLMAPFAGPSLG